MVMAEWLNGRVSPSPHESLESAGSHEIPRKIRRAKKLDIKIRETKDLEADGRISNQTVATCAMITRMKSSVKVARHKMGCGKESGRGKIFSGG
jgi:hypothetical protein